MPTKKKVKGMFDSIAGDYDSLNHILSLDVDKIWRKKALKAIVDAPAPVQILDLACGTGDFSIAVAKALRKRHLDRLGDRNNPVAVVRQAHQPVEAPGDTASGHVTGVDLSQGMLAVMREKVAKAGLTEMISMEEGDGENLRFPDNTFDRVTIAFGIRNFEDRQKGLREMLRVLKPGGRLVLLELSRPENKVIRWFYDLYFLHILPKIGGKVSGDKAAYAYLPASVATFPGRKQFTATMQSAGFRNITHKALTLGICRMYTGEK